jgi:hypothetical protein
MAHDFSNIEIGGMLAIRNRGGWTHSLPTHDIFTVVSKTATQIKALSNASEHISQRVRIKDGKVIGSDYTYAIPATPELIEQHKDEMLLARRHRSARLALSDLEGKYLHQLRLTLDQKEALAEAWTRVKAMNTTTTQQESTT